MKPVFETTRENKNIIRHKLIPNERKSPQIRDFFLYLSSLTVKVKKKIKVKSRINFLNVDFCANYESFVKLFGVIEKTYHTI